VNEKNKESLTGYLFVLPQVIGVIVFAFLPMTFLFVISFAKWDYISPIQWTGFDNFVDLLSDSFTWTVIYQTFLFTAINVPSVIIFSLLLAVLLNRNSKINRFYRSIFFLPSILPQAVIAIIWLLILAPGIGIADYVLNLVGLSGQAWLYSNNTVIPTISSVVTWQHCGWIMLIFMAGLKGISADIYEAATIDGANIVQQLIKITLPLLSPVIFFVSITGVIGAMQQFPETFIMTHGGPGTSSTFIFQHIYQLGLQYYDVGKSSAMSLLLFFIISVFTLLQFIGGKKWVNYDE